MSKTKKQRETLNTRTKQHETKPTLNMFSKLSECILTKHDHIKITNNLSQTFTSDV